MSTFEDVRILILYSEIMEYFLSGINCFLDDHPEAHVHIFELDEHKRTSYSFLPDRFVYQKKSHFKTYLEFEQVCREFNPTLILVSGRMHLHYLKVAKHFKKLGVYTITLQDTPFENTFRQFVIRSLSLILYKKYFTGFWGAGLPQLHFAASLGFKSRDTFRNLLTANLNVFSRRRNSVTSNQSDSMKFLFVGRFSKEKNLEVLIKVLETINHDFKASHQLILVGEGPLLPQLINKKNISVHPFLNAEDIMKLINEVDACCLPSTYEAWGVVIHEFAAAGLPLLLSNKCGALTEFFVEGVNGYSFNPNDFLSIYKAFTKFLSLDVCTIKAFGENSAKLSQKITPKIWSSTLDEIIKRSRENN